MKSVLAFLAMRECVEEWPTGDKLTEEVLAKLIREEPFSRGFRTVLEALHRIHSRMHNGEHRGLRLREIRIHSRGLRLREIREAWRKWHKNCPNSFPFARFESLFFSPLRSKGDKNIEKLARWNRVIEEAVRDLDQKRQQQEPSKSRGKPKRLHKGVMLSILIGHPVPDKL